MRSLDAVDGFRRAFAKKIPSFFKWNIDNADYLWWIKIHD